MSEVLNRLACASANGEHPKPGGPFHLNEYRTNRAYGGPEEGGWWYDTGSFVACHGTHPTVDAATAARDAMAPAIAGAPAGAPPAGLGAVHRVARASHRAAPRRRLPANAAALRVRREPTGAGASASAPFSCCPLRVRTSPRRAEASLRVREGRKGRVEPAARNGGRQHANLQEG